MILLIDSYVWCLQVLPLALEKVCAGGTWPSLPQLPKPLPKVLCWQREGWRASFKRKNRLEMTSFGNGKETIDLGPSRKCIRTAAFTASLSYPDLAVFSGFASQSLREVGCCLRNWET